MALYVIVTPIGSKNHLAYGAHNHRVTWCGLTITRSNKRYKYERLQGSVDGSSGVNVNPVTCENCVKRLMGLPHNQHSAVPLRTVLKGDINAIGP